MNPDRTYTFRCPTCKNEFTYDEPGEPMCTGPGVTSAHEPEVMERIRVKDKDLGTKEVSEAEGKLRAKGTLLDAQNIVALGLRVKGKLWSPKGVKDE